MAVFQSISLEKARKSAGNVTFYSRIGVQMARSKPMRKENAQFSVAQRKQQKVFKFMKANVDASNVKSLIDMLYDAKPKSGVSQTKYNMFYKSFMPHIVAQKQNIWELDNDALVDNSIFLGTAATNTDKLVNGILGEFAVQSAAAASIVVSATVLDNLIAKANAMLSENATPFTTDNIFLSFFGAASDSETEYVIVPPTKVEPALASNAYTFTTTTQTTGIDAAKATFCVMTIGYPTADESLDVEQRYFCTDSINF